LVLQRVVLPSVVPVQPLAWLRGQPPRLAPRPIVLSFKSNKKHSTLWLTLQKRRPEAAKKAKSVRNVAKVTKRNANKNLHFANLFVRAKRGRVKYFSAVSSHSSDRTSFLP